MKNPNISIENVAIDRLTANAFNVNVVSPENEAKIEESLKRNGFFKPVLTRQLEDGRLEIIGGEHRWQAAKRLGYDTVPVINLGEITGERAKEISLIDNGRYGHDDSYKLAELLGDLGNTDDLATFLPYSSRELDSIFTSVSISLDDLELPDDIENVSLPKERPVQTHSIVRFKVPIEDVATITDLIEQTMKVQKFADEDSLTNAGNALVHIIQDYTKIKK